MKDARTARWMGTSCFFSCSWASSSHCWSLFTAPVRSSTSCQSSTKGQRRRGAPLAWWQQTWSCSLSATHPSTLAFLSNIISKSIRTVRPASFMHLGTYSCLSGSPAQIVVSIPSAIIFYWEGFTQIPGVERLLKSISSRNLEILLLCV